MGQKKRIGKSHKKGLGRVAKGVTRGVRMGQVVRMEVRKCVRMDHTKKGQKELRKGSEGITKGVRRNNERGQKGSSGQRWYDVVKGLPQELLH